MGGWVWGEVWVRQPLQSCRGWVHRMQRTCPRWYSVALLTEEEGEGSGGVEHNSIGWRETCGGTITTPRTRHHAPCVRAISVSSSLIFSRTPISGGAGPGGRAGSGRDDADTEVKDRMYRDGQSASTNTSHKDRDAASTSECNVMLHALSRACKARAGVGEKQKRRLFELAGPKSKIICTKLHTHDPLLFTVDTYQTLRLITPAALSLFCVNSRQPKTMQRAISSTARSVSRLSTPVAAHARAAFSTTFKVSGLTLCRWV